MPCKYFADNGHPSKLFDKLFNHFNEQENSNEEDAEKAAVRAWLQSKTPAFKAWLNDNVTGEDQKLINEAASLSKNVKGVYAIGFSGNVRQALMDVAEQAHSSESERGTTVRIFGKRIVEIAEQIFPDQKVGTIRKTDANDEPTLSYVLQWFNEERFNQNHKPGDEFAMSSMYYSYPRSYASAPEDDFSTDSKIFNIQNYKVEELKYGNKTISIRPDKYEPGVYKLGDDYFRVTSRGFKMINQLKENIDTVRQKFVGSEGIKYSHIEDFFQGKLGMYVYDIKKLEGKDAFPMADFVGNMKVSTKDPEAHLVTGNVLFDRYITAVNDYISRLEAERRRVRNSPLKVEQLTERIEKQILIRQQLQVNKTVRFLIETGHDQIADVKRFALRGDASLVEVYEGIRLANAWAHITDTLDLSKEGKTESQLNLVISGRELQSDAAQLLVTLINKGKDYMVKVAEQEGIDLSKSMKDGEFIIKDTNAISSKVLDIAFSSNPISQLVDAVLKRNTFKSQEEHYKWVTEADEVSHRLLGSHHPDTRWLTERNVIEVLGEDGNIEKQEIESVITQYDRKFVDNFFAMKRKAENGDVTWKEFYALENKHFDYEHTDKDKAHWEDFMNGVRADHQTGVDEDGNAIYDNDAIEQIRLRYDPAVFQEYLDGKIKQANKGGRWFTKTAKDNIPLNPSYAKLTDNQKEYHKWFAEEYQKAYSASVFNNDRVNAFDIDNLLLHFSKEVMESMGDKAKFIGKQAVEFAKDSVTVIAGKTTGQVVTSPLTGKEHIHTPFKTVTQFIPEGSKSIDPLHILKQFKGASVAFNHKSDVEEFLNFVRDATDTAKNITLNNANTAMTDRAGAPQLTSSPTNIAKQIEYSINKYLTDKVKEPNKTMSSKIDVGERGFSLTQSLDSLNKLTRNRYMALSPLSAAGNFLMGAVNNFIYAADGKYFSDVDLVKATFMMRAAPIKFMTETVTNKKIVIADDKTKLVAEIMYRYNVIGDVTEELQFGESALNKLFALQKGGEFLVQGATCLAQMIHQKVQLKEAGSNGKKEGSLLDLYEFDKNTQRVNFRADKLADDDPFKDVNKQRQFFEVVKKVNQKIHGDYSGALMGKKDIQGRLLFLFRTWLPMSVKERFGSYYEDRILGAQKGRYRSAASLAKSVFQKKDENGETKFGFDTHRGLQLAKVFLKMIPGLNKHIKLSQDISELDRRNIDMFVRETQMTLMLLGAMAICKMNASGDDDDKNIIRYMYNQGERLQSELSMYYMPSSYDQIAGNIIPMSSTLIDAEKVMHNLYVYVTHPEKDIYQRGFRKGDSKLKTSIERFLPLTRSAQSVWASFKNLNNYTYSR